MDASGLEYQTLADSVWVARKVEFSRRHENLSWSHHREVASLDPEEQDYLLNAASERQLNREELRKVVKEYKKPELPAADPKTYDVIYADPPWEYDNQIESWGPTSLHYQTMSLERIKAMGDSGHIPAPRPSL